MISIYVIFAVEDVATVYDASDGEQLSMDWLEDGNGDDSADDVDPNWDSALFLLRTTEEHALTHAGVGSLCDSAQWLIDSVSGKIAQKVEASLDALETPLDTTVRHSILSACQPGQIFPGLSARYSREAFYKDHFNYVVSYYRRG